MKVAVVGATGLVGSVMIKVLEEKKFPVDVLIPAASEKSAGKEIYYNNKKVKVCSIQQALDEKPHIVLFSAGSDVSLNWAEKFAAAGCYVIDNSSAWRMNPVIPLIVPEVNIDSLKKENRIIANPNCSTIQMLVALAPLYRNFGIKKIIVSTYQSVTGSGIKGITQLEKERVGDDSSKFYARQIDLNCIPQCDVFTDNDYTKEEMKLVNETRKIFNDNNISVSATAARVAVRGGHSESVYVELEKKVSKEKIIAALKDAAGLILKTNNEEYTTALEAQEKDEVFVSRIRKDLFNDYAWNMWVVADNLRKGAATNAVQIAEYVKEKFMS
ncbi:MAG TPA: aspartate-semialdehyde dehydrogenase [Bacteroidales bacterium]|nr:aspartate-semialdehyde dehydrogenase [Bacteroidales bacterium]HPS17158.1 aspartate-semialdehyde dehydrogenase [Bacteroidales bacterium]